VGGAPTGVTHPKLGWRENVRMSSTPKIHVAVVDDHPVVRFGLAAIINLQGDMTVVGEVGSGEEACSLCEERDVDVVLMDLRLPKMSGVEAIRAIRERRPATRVIVLTTYDGDGDIRRALEAGAHAYLLKAMSHGEVTAAIRKVHAGSRVIPEEVSRTLAGVYPQSQLSPREIEVLELIASGLSNREIGAALGITEATVKWHVNIILSRLDVGDRTEAIVAALQRGIIHLR
jgi:DNA-binding NarL/FixJ family response regulator